MLSTAFRVPPPPLRDAVFTRPGSLAQKQASRLTQAVVYRPLRDAHRCQPFDAGGAVNQHNLGDAPPAPPRHLLINPSHKSPVATESAAVSSHPATLTARAEERRIIGQGF